MVLLSLAVNLLVVSAAPAAAPATAPVFTPGDAESRRFKEFFEKGEALFQQQDYGAAIANFRYADRERVTPEVAFDLAKCHEKLGDIAYTLFYYRLYMRRAPSAPDTLDVASRVGTLLAKVEAEGRGFLELDSPRGSNVLVNNRVYPEGQVAAVLPQGEYEVSADFPSGRKKMSVQIRLGKTTTVTFEPMQPPLVPLNNALTEAMVAAGVDSAAPPAASGLRVGSYVVAGVGVAALIAGAVLGGLSAADASRLSDKTLTLAQAQDYARAANSKGLGANILFGVGGAAVAGGVLMFVFSMPDGAKAPAKPLETAK